MNIERCVWNIYTFATLHGNPRDPSRLTSTGLQKLCRECRLHDACLVETPITPSQIHLIFAQEAKAATQRVDARLLEKKVVERVDYDGFLSCLLRIADVCYPNSANGEEAMMHLLVDNILPLASRREPMQVTAILESKDIHNLFSFFKEAIQSMFDFYAANAANNVGQKQLTKTTASKSRSFQEHQTQIGAMRDAAVKEEKDAKAAKEKVKKSGTFMGYEEFMRFSVDFGIASSLGLTTLDVGDIYLSVCANNGQFQAQIRHLNFEDFWEALVRCGLQAFRHSSLKSSVVKVKTLFLYMWRHIQTSIREVMQGSNNTGDLSTYKGGLIRGAQLLNERFLAMWAKDGYKDYLQADKKEHKSIGKFVAGANAVGSSLFGHLVGPPASSDPTEDADGSDDNDNDASKGNTADGDNQRHIIIDIHDDDDVGDERISPALLRQLLLERPDLARLLYNQAEEAGLLNDDDADNLDTIVCLPKQVARAGGTSQKLPFSNSKSRGNEGNAAVEYEANEDDDE